MIECDCPERDFIERNGTWVLGMVAACFTCVGGMFTYFLKSRCYYMKCCGVELKRDVLELEPDMVRVDTTKSNQ
jgi:hypothetical protein